MTTLVPKFRQPYTGAVNQDFNKKLEQSIFILDFGADPTGATDSTAAIQAAINAAGSGGTVIVDKGTYLLSATLEALGNQQITGEGVNNSIFRRYADYGDTLHFANAGAGLVEGIWFWHGDQPTPGAATIPNKVTSGAHVHFSNCQGAVIRNCWMWRMTYQILINQGSLIKIHNVNMQGIWDPFHTGAQEGIACVFLQAATLVDITDCYFAGYSGGAATVNITTSDNGTTAVDFSNINAGSQFGLLVFSSEGLYVAGCYFGGNSINNIALSPNNILSQVRISNNFFDSASYNSPCISITPQSDGQYPSQVNISDNCFNGELYSYQSIGSVNPYGSQPTIVDFQITGNTMGNGLGAGIFLRRAQGGVIANNAISSYNSRNLTAGADVGYCTGIYIDNSRGVYINDNLVGGGVNSADPESSANYCYQGVVLAGANYGCSAKNNFYNGIGTSSPKRVGRVDNTVVLTTGNYVMDGTESVVLVNVAIAAQIFLPTLVPVGYQCTIKDNTGTLSTYTIGVIGTIDGATNLIMNVNYESRTFMWNGSQWNVIGN